MEQVQRRVVLVQLAPSRRDALLRLDPPRSVVALAAMINIGAYDFRPMFDKSIYHTTPEEALNIAQDLKSKKVLGTHWGTFVLSLEPIMEPPVRFKDNAENYGFKKEDAITFNIGEIRPLKEVF